MNEPALEALQRRLVDSRGGTVVFVSHCLLNENVRYLGGACARGAVPSLLRNWQADGYGICQMPCPEQRAWGGVLKRNITVAIGAHRRPVWIVRHPLVSLFIAYTKVRYWLLARHIAAEVLDYQRSGYTVAGIVGVAGSPSCGITRTLDVHRWVDVVGRYRPERISRDDLNRDAVIANTVPGEGWFMSALFRRLGRMGVSAPRFEHDLVRELETSLTPEAEPRRAGLEARSRHGCWPESRRVITAQREPGNRSGHPVDDAHDNEGQP
jgi:hypothetical protein